MPLQTLVGHCELWISKFTGLLNSIAHRELTALHTYFASGTASLKRGPATLEQLASQLTLHKQLVADRATTEARFRPLREQYQVLEKFEVGCILVQQWSWNVLCLYEKVLDSLAIRHGPVPSWK